jgi:hypothetical protein
MGRRFSFYPLAKWQWQAAETSPWAGRLEKVAWAGRHGHTNLLLRQKRSALLGSLCLLSFAWPSFSTKNNAVHFGSLWTDMARTHD